MVVVDMALLAIVVGTVLPILVGIVTKEVASGALKSVILAFLSAVTGLVNGAINADGLFTKEAVIAAAVTWVTAVATYYGFLKPTDVSPKVNAKAWPEKGLGKG